MKKAIGYVRISDKDQSNFSITGQADIITSYCSKNNIEVVTIFTDEGESAKNFDRPDWKQLQQFIKQNHAGIDILIVAKFDRFSRNVAEALQMIELMENTYRIRVMSAMEPIHLHRESPFYFQFRSQILLGANTELLIIKDRTRFGMHHALKSGRYVSKAPIGYTNTRDGSNKPLLIINQDKAEHIKFIYASFLQGVSIQSIRHQLRTRGMIIAGNSTIQSILQNPVYMGYVLQPSYYDEPEKLIKALHDAIIDADTWWRVHAIFHQKKQPCRTTISAEFPLRGVLKCYCGRQLTAANSRGKKILVGYYKCNHHTGANFNAKRLHRQFNEILKELSLPQAHIDYLRSQVITEINNELKSAEKEQQAKQSQLSAIEKKIDQLEEKFFASDIDRATYSKWKMRYHSERGTLHDQLAALRRPADETWAQYSANFDKLADLHWLYHAAEVEQKQSFVRLGFDSELYYEAGIYRTPSIIDLFAHKAHTLKEKGLLIIEQPNTITSQFAGSAPHGNTIEPLRAFFSLLAQIKAA
jgi:site-specific DNA recombinase